MLHMHEVTGSSPVVPTTKKRKAFALRLLPSFFCAEAQANLAPAGKERRNRGAGRRVARNAPPRGPPSGVSAEPCCPHHKKRKAFAFFFLCGGAGEPRARGKRTTKPRSKGAGSRGTPPRGVPLGGVGGALLSPRLLPSFFCAEAQANLAPAGKERRNRGAGRRVARNAPPRGPPSGGVGGALLSPPKKRSGSRPFAAERADRFFRKARSPFQMTSPL